MSKILIIVGGGVKHAEPFVEAGATLGISVKVSSFAKLEYVTGRDETRVTIDGEDVANYDCIYIRLVGRRYEDVALLVYYARQKGIKLVDSVYQKDGIIRVPLPKSLETKILADAGLPIPRTIFGRMKQIAQKAPNLFGFPFVIKGTMGKQGHAVWAPKDDKELQKLVVEFTLKEREGERLIAQEFIKATQRNRIFVIGGEAIAGITRPTRWRKRFQNKVNGEYPEAVKARLDPIPQEDVEIAIAASQALGIDIGGADIITDITTGKKYILEVNSAPRWASLNKETGINIEEEIIKYLAI